MSEWVADLLAGGREYIEKNGWWRNNLVGPNGHQACAVGGLVASLGLDLHDATTQHDPRVYEAARALAVVLPPHPWGLECGLDVVTNWNDFTAKNKQEVLDAFAKAEKIERAGFDPDE